MFTVADIFVYIFSWKKVTQNAISLYHQVCSVFPNAYLINCDEHITLSEFEAAGISADRVIQLDDSYYYGGQFETAIKHCPSDKILGCIVGDVSPTANWGGIATNMLSCLNSGKVGVCAPNVDYTAHTTRAEHLWDDFYSVPNTDCTCWFLHPQLLCHQLKTIPYFALSNLGWGIDVIFIKQSLKEGLLVARDYSTIVHQPKGSGYNHALAHVQFASLMNVYSILFCNEIQ